MHYLYGAREVKEGRRTAQTYVFRRLKNPSSQHQMKDQTYSLTHSMSTKKRDKIEPLHIICKISGVNLAYLQFSEVEGISRPIHLGKEILIKHFAQQLEKINLHLIKGLALQ